MQTVIRRELEGLIADAVDFKTKVVTGHRNVI